MNDPLWYKDAVIYQLHVKSFFDANNDGIGDFAGLIAKLDYIAQPRRQRDLAAAVLSVARGATTATTSPTTAACIPITARWPTCKRFIAAAHARGIRVITELVINHTSDQHPWFQRARTAKPGSRGAAISTSGRTTTNATPAPASSSSTPKSRTGPGIAAAKAYYWHRFYSHQPDLNFDNPRVLKEVLGVMRFWLDLGVDGLRLDAVPYLVEREGTSNENLPETHAILKTACARALDDHAPGRMLLAEANQWPEDAQDYFGDGDECHMAFHFPLMPRMYMAIAQEDRFPITDIMRQTPEIPEQLPVGDLPAQPRRADARDGDRRRARLSVEHLRRRPARPAQPRHPPPARAAAGARPAPHRADERPAAVDARHAGDLLRRRDRHGRQHPSRRPRRRAHADAMVARPQRRVSRAPIPATWCCRRSWTRSTATRRSTSRRRRATSIRC